MRYVIHLLPADNQRRAFDDLRGRIAAIIGHNQALDYPTAHVTLVWSIQDGPADSAPIDGRALAAVLDEHRGVGEVPLPVRAGEAVADHVLLPLDDVPLLAALRRHLFDAVRAIVAGPNGEQRERSDRVREQTWPHLTLAQSLDVGRWERAMALLAQEGAWVSRPVLGADLALLSRNVEAGEPYRIVHRVALEPPSAR